MTPVPESGTQRNPIEPAVGVAVFANLMACFRCDECRALNIRTMWTGDLIEPELSPEGIAAILTNDSPVPFANLRWLPADMHGKRYEEVPEEIAAAAAEAHKCMGIDAYRAVTILARAAIEATAKEQGFKSGRLVQKIDAMHEARLIREDVRDGAHEVRYLGNDMAHGDFVGPVSKEDADLVLTLMDEVLEEVYQSPARVRRRRDARLAKQAAATAGPE